MAKPVDVHLNNILRLHFGSPQNGTKALYKFSIDMLVVYYEGVFLLVNLETGVVFVKFPHEKKWTLNKLRLYINQNNKELLPILSIERLGEMRSRL
jgi:hypothetical protein